MRPKKYPKRVSLWVYLGMSVFHMASLLGLVTVYNGTEWVRWMGVGSSMFVIWFATGWVGQLLADRERFNYIIECLEGVRGSPQFDRAVEQLRIRIEDYYEL